MTGPAWRSWPRAAAKMLAGAAALVLATAAPAAADPARPTNYRSTVTGVSPQSPGVRLDVVGGDSFLRVRVDKGIDVVVTGYTGEPFLEVQADGTVRANQNSPAYYLNNDRYARTKVPDGVDGKGAPQWKIVGHGGQHIWHDHRIHWMSPSAPTLTGGDKVFDWTVPITVDGRAVTVAGTLTLLGAPSPLPYLVLGALVGGAVAYVGWRRHGVLLAAAFGAAGGVIGLWLGAGQRRAVPTGAGGTPLLVVLPTIALVAAVAAALMLLARQPRVSVLLELVTVGTLSAWGIYRLPVLWHAVLPTTVSGGVDRAGTALVLAASVVVAALALRAAGALGRVDHGATADDGGLDAPAPAGDGG